MAKSGSGLQTEPPPVLPPPPCAAPDAPGWAGIGTKDGTAAGFDAPTPALLLTLLGGLGPAQKTGRRRQLICRFWSHPLRRAWLLPTRLLLPLVSIKKCDRAPVTIRGNLKLGQLSHSVCVWGGGGGGQVA